MKKRLTFRQFMLQREKEMGEVGILKARIEQDEKIIATSTLPTDWFTMTIYKEITKSKCLLVLLNAF